MAALNIILIRIISITIIGMLSACGFEPEIAPLDLPDAPPPAFGEEVSFEESPEGILTRRLDDVFNPFYLGEGMIYEGSIYQKMDRILAGAYEYYGYDLADIAAKGEPNPLTEQQFFDYLSTTGQHTVFHPDTEAEIGVYEWLQRRLGMTAGSAHSAALDKFDDSYKINHMNFEVNYLAALYAANEARVATARFEYRDRLQDLYGEDAAAMQEYLDSLEPVGIE